MFTGNINMVIDANAIAITLLETEDLKTFSGFERDWNP